MNETVFATSIYPGDEVFVPGPNHLAQIGSLVDTYTDTTWRHYRAIVTQVALDPTDSDNLLFTVDFGARGTYEVAVRTDAFVRRTGAGKRPERFVGHVAYDQ